MAAVKVDLLVRMMAALKAETLVEAKVDLLVQMMAVLRVETLDESKGKELDESSVFL
jgi:hypothetical protein